MIDNKAGRYIRAKRRSYGLTQEAVGLALGYPKTSAKSTISRWEDGIRNVPTAQAKALAQLLKIPIELILP